LCSHHVEIGPNVADVNMFRTNTIARLDTQGSTRLLAAARRSRHERNAVPRASIVPALSRATIEKKAANVELGRARFGFWPLFGR